MNPTHVSMRAHAWQPKGSRFQRFCDPWGNGRAGPSLMCVSTELSRRLPCWLRVKNPPANAGDTGSILVL